ncbi:DUF7302 family protein [Mycobacterium antarcticum]|nr:hypothetical protein TUM20984_49890 [Mycolicibacterium sp. TUM20984]
MRLRNQYNGVQVVVPDEKAARLIADGTYKAVPDAEQPPKDTALQEKAVKIKPGPTSIAAALKDAVGPTWDQAE